MDTLGPGSDLVFFDLGSGVGRLVAQAYLEWPAVRRAVGVELSAERAARGTAAWAALAASGEALALRRGALSLRPEGGGGAPGCSPAADVQLLEGDLLLADLAEATHVYLSSLCFGDALLARVAERLVRDAPRLRAVASLRALPSGRPPGLRYTGSVEAAAALPGVLQARDASPSDADSDEEEDDDRRDASPARHGLDGIDTGGVLEDPAALESMRRAAYEACLAEVRGHLEDFLKRRPRDSYERWIADLHPENVRSSADGRGSSIDDRFYIEGNDYRSLWNARVEPARRVAARRMGAEGGGRTAPSLGQPAPRRPVLVAPPQWFVPHAASAQLLARAAAGNIASGGLPRPRHSAPGGPAVVVAQPQAAYAVVQPLRLPLPASRIRGAAGGRPGSFAVPGAAAEPTVPAGSGLEAEGALAALDALQATEVGMQPVAQGPPPQQLVLHHFWPPSNIVVAPGWQRCSTRVVAPMRAVSPQPVRFVPVPAAAVSWQLV
ncbi:unnamed protein product [Prorocentrum cordatum]|uniref:Histone H3-K79 methyltransferase n=1 Tax=Prorocentrum cordatum TaxID=2364126 RepID=A0ABN9SS00_9DINO|nr:unnamed protein product [Polarella glacialis]